MKIQYLGTSGSEGVPALMCACENCAKSRMIGGRALRTHAQALIDGRLLIDFPAETLVHTQMHNVDLLGVSDCIITHSHYDHLQLADLAIFRPSPTRPVAGWHMTFHGSAAVGEAVSRQMEGRLEELDCFSFESVEEYVPKIIGGYTVTPLKAIHSLSSGPLLYQISDGEKTVLYGTDTHYLDETVWKYWEKTSPHFDMVTLDCTNACKPMTYKGHMSLAENVRVRERMIEMGIADEKTLFVCTHFSHNGTNVVYDEFMPIAAKEGFITSYDGMVLEI